jgi:hypothetical protein
VKIVPLINTTKDKEKLRGSGERKIARHGTNINENIRKKGDKMPIITQQLLEAGVKYTI